jgi:hypothetical protein
MTTRDCTQTLGYSDVGFRGWCEALKRASVSGQRKGLAGNGRSTRLRAFSMLRSKRNERCKFGSMRQTGTNGIETKVDYTAWQQGFSVGSTHGMTCDICSCLVRQTPTDAVRHTAWHRRVDRP